LRDLIFQMNQKNSKNFFKDDKIRDLEREVNDLRK